MAYLYFQGEPSGFDERDSFQKELKEGQRSNEVPGEQIEANVSMHDRAQGGTVVLQAPKARTAVPLILRLCTSGRAGWHGRALLVLRDISSGFDCFEAPFGW